MALTICCCCPLPPPQYVDSRRSLHSGTASLKRGYYLYFQQNTGYYFEINGYKYDPDYSRSLRFC